MEKMKIGLVGAGGMGKVHYANFREIEGCEVAALVGHSERAAATAAATPAGPPPATIRS